MAHCPAPPGHSVCSTQPKDPVARSRSAPPCLTSFTHPPLHMCHLPSLILLTTLLFAACSDTNTKTSRTVAVPAERVAPEQIRNRTTTNAPTTTGAQPASAGMLNPPHGEPGHVCGVPVGSPLDGSAANMATTTTISPESQSFGATNPGGSTTALGGSAPTSQQGMINPPHGEPGHVCGQPVGEPLR